MRAPPPVGRRDGRTRPHPRGRVRLEGPRNWRAGRGPGCGAFWRAQPAAWRRRWGARRDRRRLLAGQPAKRVDTCADYVLKYAPYLHQDRHLVAGYPIATGVIEGAYRHLVRDRMESTGARWRLPGPEAMPKGAASQRRLPCVLGFPRSARVQAEPRPTLMLTRWHRRPRSHSHRPPHLAFDASSRACHPARRKPIGPPTETGPTNRRVEGTLRSGRTALNLC